MRTFSALFLSVLVVWISGCSSPTDPGTPSSAGSTAQNDMPFPKLEKGDSAETIRQKLGQPLEIRPTPSPEGKAEIWIYKYKKSLGMTQVAAGTRDVQVMTTAAPGAGMATKHEPVLTLAEKNAYITLSLLIFDGHLQVQKAAVEETVEHQ